MWPLYHPYLSARVASFDPRIIRSVPIGINKTRRRVLQALLIVGVAIGPYYAFRMIAYPMHAEIVGKHVLYQDTASNTLGLIAIVLYLFATVAALVVSSTKRVYVLGIIMGLSFIVSAFFYIRCLTSVWCFFAAVMSFWVSYIVRDEHKKFHFPKHALAMALAQWSRHNTDTIESPCLH